MLTWSRRVGFSLNLRKSKILWVPRVPQCPPPLLPDLLHSDHVRMLGVIFTTDLKWNTHFDSIVKCASKRLYALRILRPIFDRDQLKIIYQSLILSLREYCSPLFAALSIRNVELLRKLQRRSHRLVCSQECDCNLLPDLSTRREAAVVKLLLNCLLYTSPSPRDLSTSRMPSSA